MQALPPLMGFESYYDADWLERHEFYFVNHRERFLQTWNVIAGLGLGGEGKVLDVGGVGPIATYITKSIPGWTACGSRTDLRGPLPFENESFDLVLCTEVIEHIKDVDSKEIRDLEAFNFSGVFNMLREIMRILKKNGFLLITTPNACSILVLKKWLCGKLPLMDPRHVHEFTPVELKWAAEKCGFKPHTSIVVDSWDTNDGLDSEVLDKLLRADTTFESVARGDNIIAVFVKP